MQFARNEPVIYICVNSVIYISASCSCCSTKNMVSNSFWVKSILFDSFDREYEKQANLTHYKHEIAKKTLRSQYKKIMPQNMYISLVWIHRLMENQQSYTSISRLYLSVRSFSNVHCKHWENISDLKTQVNERSLTSVMYSSYILFTLPCDDLRSPHCVVC